MKTSENAEATTSTQLTLFAADSLASLTVWPGSDEARKMTATSGRNIAALLPNSDPGGYLARTFLESLPPCSTRCYLTWKVRATPRRRSVFRLWPSMPRIEGIGCSLWHTPNVPNGGRVNPVEMSQAGKMPDGRKRQVGLSHQVKMVERQLWPTPAANERHALPGTNEQFDPTKQRFYRPTGHNFGVTLGMAVKMWRTPRANDWKGGLGPNTRSTRSETDYFLPDQVNQSEGRTGQLNPTWVEWLQGFPLNWTEV